MPHDPKKIVHSALAFRLAAHRSLEPRPVSRSTHEFEILMIPAIVCKAFSLELFLKAILALFHIQGRGQHRCC